MWANNANDKNGRINLAFPTYKWNAVNLNVTSVLAPNSNFRCKCNTPLHAFSQWASGSLPHFGMIKTTVRHFAGATCLQCCADSFIVLSKRKIQE